MSYLTTLLNKLITCSGSGVTFLRRKAFREHLKAQSQIISSDWQVSVYLVEIAQNYTFCYFSFFTMKIKHSFKCGFDR